jgi:ATP-dependent helicase/DNAse subunit B
MEAPIRKGKRGPIARSPEHNLSEMLGIRVTPGVKHIYKSMADNFGLSETDLFYQLMAIGNFMNMIMPEIEKQLSSMTKVGQEERNAIWLAKFKTMMKGFSLISDLENERQYVRGKNQNTDAKKMAEIENVLIDYLEKKFK